MVDKYFYQLFGDALESNDRDAYISDWVTSSMWCDAPNAEEIPTSRITFLGSIWDAAHRTMKEIASVAGMSQRKLAERFCVPYRTMEDWCRGVRTPPDYVRLMAQECLGIIVRD